MNPLLFDKPANLRRMKEYAKNAAAVGVDLIAFPELSLTGYMCKGAFHDLAETIPGPSVDRLVETAAENRIYLVAGMPERVGNDLYNSAVLCGPEGFIGVWRKVFLPHFVSSSGIHYEEKEYFSSGLQAGVFQTRLGRIGIQICYEIWFPEVSRAQALQGAWLLLNISAAPAGVPTTFRRLGQARALEDICWFGYVNQAGEQDGISFGGGSCMIDCFGSIQDSASTEEKAVEEVCVCEVNPETVHERRRSLPVLRDHRKEFMDLCFSLP